MKSVGSIEERAEVELLLGLEPRTSSLPRKCSTTELQQPARLRHGHRNQARTAVERAMGIEPTCAAWKAAVLPLNYARMSCGRR